MEEAPWRVCWIWREWTWRGRHHCSAVVADDDQTAVGADDGVSMSHVYLSPPPVSSPSASMSWLSMIRQLCQISRAKQFTSHNLLSHPHTWNKIKQILQLNFIAFNCSASAKTAKNWLGHMLINFTFICMSQTCLGCSWFHRWSRF